MLGRAPTAPVAAGATVAALESAAAQASGAAEPVRGRDWLARGATGSWLLGRHGQTTALATTEIGLAVGNGWLVTAEQRSYGRSISWRGLDGGRSGASGMAVVPASVGIAASTAYIGGFERATGGDPGLFRLNLADGAGAQVLKATSGNHPRTVAVSADQSVVVSAACDDAEQCELTTLSSATGAQLGAVGSPGYLRSTTASVAIVGPDPANWIAGIDLVSGRELWRRPAVEIWSGYTTSDGRLVQAELQLTGGGPTFVVEVIAPQTGSARTLLRAPVGHGIGLWPELSSDDQFAVGPAYSLEDGLSKASGAAVAVRMFSVADGHQVGSQTIDGSN